jgi:hypothetical protein
VKRYRVAIVATFVVAAGCRAALGIDDSRPTLSDAGTDATDEAGEIGDGGAEAAPPMSVYCKMVQPPPGFCDDFDMDPFEKGWDNYGTTPDPGVGGGATLGLDTTQWKSAPRSALMTIPQLLAGRNAESLLITEVPKGFAVVEIFADVRIETEDFPDLTGHAAVIGMTFDGYEPFVEIRRTMAGAYLRFDDANETMLLQPFPVGMWKNVELRFTFAPDAGTVATYIDGVPAGGGNVSASFYHVDAYPRVVVGPSLAQGPMGELRMNVDNVVLRGSGKFGQ